MKAISGYFLPDARVLCARCHGPEGKHGRTWKLTPAQQAEREALRDVPVAIRCDTCGSLCDTGREDVQILGRVRDRLDFYACTAKLEQTGGMCVALLVPGPGGRDLWLIAMDEDNRIEVSWRTEENEDSPTYTDLKRGLDARGAVRFALETRRANEIR